MPSIQYTPAVGYTGTETFTYRATNVDGSFTVGTVTVNVAGDTIAVVDDHLTVRVGTPFTYQLSLNDDLTGLNPTYSVVGSLPAGIQVTSTGIVSGTFESESAGSVGVTVVLPDGASGGSTFSWRATLAEVQADAWLAPITANPGVTDADRVAVGLGGIESWTSDYALTAAELKSLGDEVS